MAGRRSRFGADGLVPVVAQESRSGDVLMVAYANREALERTARHRAGPLLQPIPRPRSGGRARRRAMSRRSREIRLDCDGDAVLYRVDQTGPACHTGSPTCFSTAVGAGRRPRRR